MHIFLGKHNLLKWTHEDIENLNILSISIKEMEFIILKFSNKKTPRQMVLPLKSSKHLWMICINPTYILQRKEEGGILLNLFYGTRITSI